MYGGLGFRVYGVAIFPNNPGQQKVKLSKFATKYNIPNSSKVGYWRTKSRSLPQFMGLGLKNPKSAKVGHCRTKEWGGGYSLSSQTWGPGVRVANTQGLGLRGLGLRGLGFRGLGLRGLGLRVLGLRSLGFRGLGF